MADEKKYNGNGTNGDGRIITFPDKNDREEIKKAKQGNNRTPVKEPFINLPPYTKFFVLAVFIIHFITAVILDPEKQYWVLAHFGFMPSRYATFAITDWAAYLGPLTYMFLHGSWLHVTVNGFMMMALGTGIERMVGGKRMLFLFVACSLISALVHLVFNFHDASPVVGASGGISGLFAVILVLLQTQSSRPTGKYGMWPLIIIWTLIMVLFGQMGSPDGHSVAWAAHVGGFLAGFLLLKPVLNLRL